MMRIRLLPILIVSAGASLTFKLSDLVVSYPNSSGLQKLWGGTAQAADPTRTSLQSLTSMVGLSPEPKAKAGGGQAASNTAVVPAGTTVANTATSMSEPAAADGTTNTMLGAKAELPKDPTRFSQSEIDLLQSLAQRRDSLDTREQQLQQRQMTLDAAEKRLAEKAAALEGMKGELMQLINRRNQADDDRLRRLVKIYEGMKPVLAAQILQGMDTKDAVGVLERMKELRVAPILGAMTPARAQLLSSLMADRPSTTTMSGTNQGSDSKKTGFEFPSYKQK
ncbi:MAG: hypothetical protein QM523_10160 [Candidatus Pacebacteria bacterium]|nr:hypothetical protein [Candidatus Paceibacterota bacterium]